MNPAELRGPRALVVAATAGFGLAIAWGLFARVGSGHDAVVCSRAIIAENMSTWGIWGPVREYTLERPGPDLYYVHHPWGTFWTIAAFARVLGRATYVPRLVAILLSLATPPLLYGIGRRLWGPWPGALSALTYCVLPISLAFGNFPGFEGQLDFGCLLATWGYLRFAERWRRRWMAVSLLGVLVAANTDWEANLFFAFVLVPLSTAAFWVPPRWFGRVNLVRFAQWAGMSLVFLCATLVLYVAYLQRIGAIGALLAQEVRRSRGSEMPLSAVLEARRYWIDVCFTPVAVVVGKVALPILVFRVLVLRRLHEVFPIALLGMAAIQYVKFKNGADVHIYWPLPFAPYAALSMGVVAATCAGLARRARLRWPAQLGALPAEAAALGACGLVAICMLPDGIEGLRYARATGGRFNEKGSPMLQDKDKSQAMEWMAQRMEPRTGVQGHTSLHAAWGQDWAVHRPLRAVLDVPAPAPGPAAERYFVGDMRFMNVAEQRRLFATFHVVAVGPFVFVDRLAASAPADAYVFEEREPTLLEWYFVSPTEPMRTIVPDAYSTWELRDAFGQTPNDAPREPARTPEQLRIAHNIAVFKGDEQEARRLEGALLGRLDRHVEAHFSGGVRLLGQVLRPGVAPELSLYFAAEGPLDNEYQFAITSLVTRARSWSLVEADEKRKQSGVPFSISPRAWRKGYVYAENCDIRQRPGQESYWGDFGLYKMPTPVNAPHPTIGPPEIPLLVLP